MKSRGDQLRLSGVRQQVTCQLLDSEPVERHVLVERTNDPVPVRPDVPEVIEMQPVRVRIPGGVEPVAGTVFAIMC